MMSINGAVQIRLEGMYVEGATAMVYYVDIDELYPFYVI
jgi:hypothetical protein